MGYIYELMDLAKGKIAFTCGGIERNYGLIWIKIDVRWTPQLSALGYCLNLKCTMKINSLMRCGTDYLNAYIGCYVIINI